MPTYQAPVRDALFLLEDVFDMSRYGNVPSFALATPDVVRAVLDEAAKLAEDVIQPTNATGSGREGAGR